MSGRFVGRRVELDRVERALQARESLWITGPAGIGKSRLAREAIGARRAVVLDGHFMTTPADALRHLGERLGSAPGGDRPEAIAAWLSSSLGALTERLDVLVIDDLHAAVRELATRLLRQLRRTAVGYPVLAIARDSWHTADLVGDHLHHLPLYELDERDSEELARSRGRRSSDLQPAALGHPLLMLLSCRNDAQAIDEWIDSLLGELSGHRALLMRLAIAQSPAQLCWALRGHGDAELEQLRQQAMFHHRRGLFRPVEHGIRRAMDERGQREDLERELLAYLAARPALSERDLTRALQLAFDHGDHATLAALLGRPTATPPAALTRTDESSRPQPAGATPADPPVAALKRLIDSQWSGEVNLEAFARAHNQSRFALSRRFKTRLGRSPRQYLQEIRIHHAKRRLIETDRTVTDIAYECGFSDAAQLSRLFKEATGLTPVHYRESNRRVSGSTE